MATFTSASGSPVATPLTLHTKGSRRLHLNLTDSEKKQAHQTTDLPIISTNPTVAAARTTALFNGPRGIWTVDLQAGNTGATVLSVVVAKSAIATLPVNVVPNIVLPPESSDSGLLVRLFLAESQNPGWRRPFDAALAKQGMQWMRLVIANRLANNPAQFGAPNAKTIADIIEAKRQFEGFSGYPLLAADQQSTISSVLKAANEDDNPQQSEFAAFVNSAIDVATGLIVPDPAGPNSFLAGWMTTGSSPGGQYIPFAAPILGNQFFALPKAN